MAINYNVHDAVKVIRDGKDIDAIVDICRRYPALAILANTVNEGGMKILAALPEYITARKVNKALIGDDEEAVEASDDEEEIPKKKAKKADEKASKKSKKKADDEDEDEKAPKKKGKKAAKKSKVEDDDDDDDFDFDD